MITKCLIDVDLAIALKQTVEVLGLKVPNGDLGFTCPGCGQPVKAHEGERPTRHFEHLPGHQPCAHSDKKLAKG